MNVICLCRHTFGSGLFKTYMWQAEQRGKYNLSSVSCSSNSSVHSLCITEHIQEANQPGPAPSHMRRGNNLAAHSAAAQTTSLPHVWTAPGWRHLETAPARQASGACTCAPLPSNGQKKNYNNFNSNLNSQYCKIKIQCYIYVRAELVHDQRPAPFFLQPAGQSRWMERITCEDLD